MTSATGLASYLNDHLAGATAGSELATNAGGQGGTFEPDASFLAELAREIAQDKAALEDLMERLGVRRLPVKQVVGWVGEKLSRAKLSETATGDRELTRLLTFEVLSLGIEGKLLMWQALTALAGSHPEIAATDLEGLAERARSQRSGVEEHRLRMAAQALSG